MYDVAIVGGGPAGATLARLIGDRYKVLLIEKRQLPDWSENFSSIKCCGGLLAPDAQMMLSKLGLGLPRSVLEEPQLFVVKSIDIPQRLERYYQRHYINMNRKKFESFPPEVQKIIDDHVLWASNRMAEIEVKNIPESMNICREAGNTYKHDDTNHSRLAQVHQRKHPV